MYNFNKMYNFDIYNIHKAKNNNINYPDIYFTPEYGEACEKSDNGKWELCIYKDLMFCYIIKINEYKIITPYGYSGFYYENQNTFKEFIPLFKKYLKSINITKQIIRQNPYLSDNINISDNFFKQKTIFAINIKSKEDYLKNVLNSKTRNILTKANKIGLKYEIIENSIKLNYINKFIELYYKSMLSLKSSDYYYFNNEYFQFIFKLKNTILCIIKDKNDKEIGYGLFFYYKHFLHYHLSCNDKSNNCIHNFMIYQVLLKYGLNKIFILGGGVQDNDNLYKFKKKITNLTFNYKIYNFTNLIL